MTRRLDLVVINPGDRREIYQGLGSAGLSAVEPPVWVGIIAGYAKSHQLSVEIIDANAENLSPDETASRVRDLDPILTAVVVYGHNPSASTQVMPSAGRICTAIKRLNPEQHVLLVGGHVSALPERTMTEEDADFVGTGEGPVTIGDLISALKCAVPDFNKVRGILYSSGKDVVRTDPAPNIGTMGHDVLDDISIPFDLLPMSKYVAHNWHALGFDSRQPYASIYTTLGCPYRCEFCCIQAPFKSGESLLGLAATTNSYRFWSPATIVNQLESLVRDYGVRHVKFADEMFVLNPGHVRSICEGIIARGLGDELNIWAYARVDTVRDEESCQLLKSAGFNWLCFGIEAASDRVRKDVRKGFRDDVIHTAIARVRAAGIHSVGNFIVGLPEDDMESMRATLDLALELNCEWFNIYSAMAYPGSELYEVAMREGWKLPDNWSGYSQHSVDCLPLPTRYLSAGQVLSFRDYAFQRYFTDPRYLDMVQRTFGSAAVEHIKTMTSKTLVREFAEALPNLPS